ncbi:MAG: glycosyltransferase family 39 protein [Magnetococcales bacterium]|nr:glycosyltransferase family 39 protein [Magnetococcales bacterium]
MDLAVEVIPRTAAPDWEAVYDRLSTLILVCLGLLMLITCRDYGYSYDEVWQNRFYGKAIASFYATFGVDVRALKYLDLHLFGGLYDTLSEMLAWLLPLPGHLTRRIVNVLTGFLAFVGTWKTGRVIAGPKAGFWSLLFLAMTPVFYGHTFINAKDIPFATGTIWTLYYLIRLVERPLDVSKGLLIKLGLSMALAIGVRIGGILLIGYMGLAWTIVLLFHYRRHPGIKESWHYIQQSSLARAFFIPLTIASGLMLLFWPYLCFNPLRFNSILQAATHHVWTKSVLFKGHYVYASKLPWDYIPGYFLVNLPELLVIISVPVLIWSLWKSWKHWHQLATKEFVALVLLLVSTLMPPAIVIINHSAVYDGIRHLLFVVPSLAVLSGVAFAQWGSLVQRLGIIIRPLLIGIFAIYLTYHIHLMIKLHPYQYVFYNIFAGGMPEASKWFETDYWMTSYYEAAKKIIDYARQVAARENVAFEDRRFTVGVFYVPINIKEFMPKNFIILEEDQVTHPDFILASTRWDSDKKFPQLPVIDRIERLGMIFSVIKSPHFQKLF